MLQKRKRYWVFGTLSMFAAGLGIAKAAIGGVVVIDDTRPGTVYDAILDGYPGFYVQDGIPDAGGNNLAVALKTGAVEMRAIAEFPLSPLSGRNADDLRSARLVFNVDDVLGYLGTPLSGCAAEEFLLWVSAGDGAVTLSDFYVGGPPVATVTTGPPCSITDTTLGATGPVRFEADVTEALRALLQSSAGFARVVWRTNSENTGTSIDNLGLNGMGPAGARGARMPHLVVELEELPPPQLDARTRRCQRVIASQAIGFGTGLQLGLAECTNRMLKDIAAGKPLVKAVQFCQARLDGSDSTSDASKKREKARRKILSACGARVDLGALGPPCGAEVTDPEALATCVLDSAFESAQRSAKGANGLLCRVLTAAGLDNLYRTSCLAD